jgi:hypothetical protein
MSCRSDPACSAPCPRTTSFSGPVRGPGQGGDRAGSVNDFTELQISFLDQLTASIGIVLNSIEATMQTEGLLVQSQQLAGELQTQQRELTRPTSSWS